jgi:hypothetical protein
MNVIDIENPKMKISLWTQSDNKAKGKELQDKISENKHNIENILKEIKKEESNEFRRKDGQKHKVNKENLFGKKIEEKNPNLMFRDIYKKISDIENIAYNVKRENDEIMEANAKFVMQNSRQMANNEKKKDFKMKNFVYVNDFVRSKFMSSFLNYNPTTHHNNVIRLGQVNDDIRRDYEDLDMQIDEDLEEVLDPFYHTKKYEKLNKKNLERKMSQPIIFENKIAEGLKEEIEKQEKERQEREKQDKENDKDKKKDRHKTILNINKRRRGRDDQGIFY